MTFKRTKVSYAVASALVFVGSSGLALAQQQTQKIEKIEVTGSNIKRVDVEGAAPIDVITREDIQRSAAPSLGELLRSVPSNSGNSYNETFTNSFSPGASGIGLRGLGQKSTLVLINGRRMANYGFAQNLQDTYVDLNSIPKSAIERIEILKDGASAIYGSDAIAGVVNVILRKDYAGIEAGANYGRSTEGGLAEKGFNLVGGMGQLGKDRFNFLGVFDYFKRDGLLQTERKFTRDQDFRGYPGGPFGWSANAATYRGVPGASRAPFATCTTSFPGGTVLPASQFSASLTGNVCSYNVANYLSIFPESERVGFFGKGTFEISPSLTAFAELSLSRNESKQKFTPPGLNVGAVAFDPRTGGVRVISNVLPTNNPSNPYGRPTGIAYTFFDVGGRDSKIDTNAGRFLAGLKGSFGNWDWETAVGHARSKTEQINYNRVDAFVLERVIANGSYNFLNPSLTPGITDQLRIHPRRESLSKLTSVDVRVSTDLAQLPAGPLGFATGLEWRKESIEDRPDQLLTNGNVLGQGATATNGERRATAGFFEFNIPVIKSLEFQVAGRQDRYSDFGSAFSPKVAARFTPVKELLFRASFAKGFRAPTLPENSQSSATFFTTVIDPNDGLSYNVAGVFRGNPKLKAERSESYSFGFVFEPVNSVNFGIDYYRIKQKDLVSTNGFQYIANHPGQFPGAILRDPTTGQIVSISDGYGNLNKVETKGLDFDAKIGLPGQPIGKFTLRGNASYILSFKIPDTFDGDPVEGAGNNASNNGSSYPRFRSKVSLDWDYADVTTTLSANYISHYAQFQAAKPAGTGTRPPEQYVKALTTLDLYLAYKGIKNLTLTGSVLNLQDKQPPYDPSFTNGYDFTQADLRGRYVRVGAEYKFK